MTPIAVLSPHPDDAVLSCWHALTGAGELTVINVFAGVPDAARPVSWWDRLTGAADSAERMRTRLVEDRRALALAGREALNLRLFDDQYRDGPQSLDEVASELRRHLAAQAAVLAPAGIGAHPDHLLVRTAAISLRDNGHAVALYADLPHAIRHGWPRHVTPGPRPAATPRAEMDWQQALAQIGQSLSQGAVHTLSAQARADKIKALRAYRTQLGALNTMAYQPLDAPDTLRHEVIWSLR
jgi:LmbE family N-acetylglucosaminyl deacetylase